MGKKSTIYFDFVHFLRKTEGKSMECWISGFLEEASASPRLSTPRLQPLPAYDERVKRSLEWYYSQGAL